MANKKKNLGGRPKKDPADVRSERLNLKLTPAELALIQAASDEPYVFAREAVVRAASRVVRRKNQTSESAVEGCR